MNIPQTAQCDVRVLMLLYNTRKKQYMGLIPKDQAGFLNDFKQVIESTRAKQGNKVRVLNIDKVEEFVIFMTDDKDSVKTCRKKSFMTWMH